MKGYAVLFFDGIGPINPWPEAPTEDNVAPSISKAVALFKDTARATMHNGIPTNAGGPFACVYPAECWDGISYGDAMLGQILVGPRGGVRFESA